MSKNNLEQVVSDLDLDGYVAETLEIIIAQAAEARKQAELAYEFVPNSYTHSAMVATRNAERAFSMFLPKADADG
jgi:hypothetical protein